MEFQVRNLTRTIIKKQIYVYIFMLLYFFFFGGDFWGEGLVRVVHHELIKCKT